MSVTYGFYDSIGGDRKYNAEQFDSIFKGIINDGIFKNIGGALKVTTPGALTLSVATGKCWFNNKWVENDATLNLTAPEAHSVYDRIDAVIVEIDSSTPKRECSIKILKGIPSSSPVRPTLKQDSVNKIWQYALAYYTVAKTATVISGLTDVRGTAQTQWITNSTILPELNQIIADEWIQKTYRPGEYAISENKLWKCLVANNVMPSEGSNWTQVRVDGEISTINRILSTKQDKLTNPLTQADVINNLTSTATNKPLSAAQGRELNGLKFNTSNVKNDWNATGTSTVPTSYMANSIYKKLWGANISGWNGNAILAMSAIGSVGNWPGISLGASADLAGGNMGIQLAGSTTVRSWSIAAISDRKVKTNIIPSKVIASEIIKELKPVEFDYIDEKYGKHTELGYIAQDLEEILPSSMKVVTDAYDDKAGMYKSILYEKIIPLLMKSIQELINQNEKLEQRITELEIKED